MISPGPAMLFVLRCSQASSVAAASAVTGLVAGDVVLIALSAVGFASLVAQVPAIAAALRLVGAAYVACVGVSLLRWDGSADEAAPRRNPAFMGALLITLANPKAILFFAAFFPLFMPPRAETLTSFLTLACSSKR